MKYILILFFVFLYPFGNSLDAQVFSDKYLLKTHQGSLESSSNYSGDALDFTYEFIEEKSKVKKSYELKIYHRKNLLGTYKLRIRNLIVTCYFELALKDKTGETKTLTAVYDKGNKWMRVKFAPQKNCSKPNQKWERFDDIQSFDEILRNIIYEMDKNLILDCYLN